MPARTIKVSIQYRSWVDAALADGCESPSQVLEWIEQKKGRGQPSPSLPTISKIMRERGYEPIDKRWEKKGKVKDE
jgi:hypothetical protein